jgi:hypothetical protein
MTDTTIPAFLDRRPLIGTYTMLAAYANCEHAMYRRYIKKDQPYVESPEMAFGNMVHSAMEHRVGSKKPLPADMRQWEGLAASFDGYPAVCEQKLGLTEKGQPTGFWDKDVWFRGKIDLAIANGTQAYIADWKTGNSKFEDPFELETSALLIRAHKPALAKIVGSYIWLKEDRVGQQYDLSDFAGTWKRVCRLMSEIKGKQPDEFEKHKSGLCSWCSVKDCENWRERK